MNVLKEHLRITVATMLANGASQREIERRIGVDRKTIRRYAANSPGVATGSEVVGGQNPPPRPPAPPATTSSCEPHRAFIEQQIELGRNAQSIYQDLVEHFGFAHRYNSVKRFVRARRARDPERFDVLEFPPGEEAQVDYGQGALTRTGNGHYRRPYLFVMTLKYSGKSFRKVVWKTNQEIWARLHEEAFRAFGGVAKYVVLDNLREGVIRPDLYEPELNALYAAVLAHYGVVADVCRVGDPNRKGTVESAIQHTQGTALKGRRFESIEEQNAWLAHWEEAWAAPRIHGRKKRQVMEMFLEEKPLLLKLPVEGFRYFAEETRTVDDAGLVQVKGTYYPALPAKLYSQVKVRIFENEIEIRDLDGLTLRRHPRVTTKGKFNLKPEDRIFNPTRETTKLIEKIEKIGPKAADLAREMFKRLGRAGNGAIYGLSNLTRDYRREDVEAACERVLSRGSFSYQAVKRLLDRGPKKCPSPAGLKQSGEAIRPIADYQMFFDNNANKGEKDGDVYH